MKFFAFVACFLLKPVSAVQQVGIDDDSYYVDYSFSCPLQGDPSIITCDQVCVELSTDCPAELQCGVGEMLCIDGSCQTTCPSGIENPCDGYGTLSTACYMGGYTDTISGCEETFASFYEEMDAADGDDVYDDDYYGELVDSDYAGFVFFYCWMGGITLLAFMYYMYNNKLAPIGESKDFLPEIHSQSFRDKEIDNAHCSQTGYCKHPFGMLMYLLVILTLVGIQIVILLLVIAYYFIGYRSDIREDTPDLSMSWSPFKDAPQTLYAFIIVWAIGLVWTVLFKRPQSIFASFLRRSSLEDATHVAIFIPAARGVEVLDKTVETTWFSRLMDQLHKAFDATLSWLFSEPQHAVPGTTEYCPVQTDRKKYIIFRMRRYHFDEKKQVYAPGELDVEGTANSIIERKGGLSAADVARQMSEVGPNVIALPKPSFIKILVAEFSRIFYVYQNFMTWTWLNYSYWHMGIVNTLVYTLGGLVVSYVNYSNSVRLQALSKIEGTIEVLRDGKFSEIDQREIVPGDVVSVKSGPAFCDMVILTGETVVDESSLTGESMPVVKTAIDPTNPQKYNAIHHHKHHSIFAGTIVTSDPSESDASGEEHRNLALVMRTGSHTMKGELLRDMMYGAPKKFKFDVEVNFVLVILLCYAIFGFSMTIYFLNSEPVYGFFYAIYVVAATLPPLLPTVFIVSEGISADRLLKKKVAVSDSHRILMAGKVRVAFFDKTGTLTEQGLDFLSVMPAGKNGTLEEPNSKPSGQIALAMGVCHSVKKMIRSGAEIFVGNAIDRHMFQATGFEFVSGNGKSADVVVDHSGAKFSILRQFDFDSKRKMHTVVIREESTGKLWAYTKGTGEAIKSISVPSSIPSSFDDILTQSAKSGIYQISIGFRMVEADSLTCARDLVERDMSFIGFINFTNSMKPQTPDVIRQLREGDIRSVMISGDHALTAIYMARLSGMIHNDSCLLLGKNILPNGDIEWVDAQTDAPAKLPSVDSLASKDSNVELALLGHVWDYLILQRPEDAINIGHFVRVIGRCSPATKISIVDCFNKQGFITLMCGDGGNDCGALKTAHVGIALSDSEASVVSPFTSIDKNITSVIDVLKEGRCTLASAISSYKYMIMYGQVETINQIINAWFSITFSEWCWVFMDGFWVITMAFSLPFSGVAEKLAPSRPTSSILGPHTLASVLGVLAINFLYVVMALGILFLQDWFQCRKWEEGSVADVTSIGDNYETEVIFLVSGYQYVSSGIAYNFGFQHRAGWFSNWRFVLCVIAWSIIHGIIVWHPSTLSCFFRVNCDNENVVRGATSDELTPIQNEWNTTVMPLRFRLTIFIIIVANTITLILWEYFVVNGFVATWVKSFFPKQNKLLGGVGYLGRDTALAVPFGNGKSRDLEMVSVHPASEDV